MAKIFLQGQNDPVTVSEDEARAVLELKNDAKHKGMIQIGNMQVSKGKVGKIVFGDKTEGGGYNLSDPQDKAKILEFELMLDGLREQKSPEPIEFYGRLLNDQQKFPGLVTNSLLGGVHWTVVKYALDNEMIRRGTKPYVHWAILDHGTERRVDISLFIDFDAKLRALGDLQARRNYAQKMSAQELEKLADKREDLLESTAMPKPVST